MIKDLRTKLSCLVTTMNTLLSLRNTNKKADFSNKICIYLYYHYICLPNS